MVDSFDFIAEKEDRSVKWKGPYKKQPFLSGMVRNSASDLGVHWAAGRPHLYAQVKLVQTGASIYMWQWQYVYDHGTKLGEILGGDNS